MNLLFLTSRLPYPPHKGDQLKVYQLLRHFSREHTITLVTFVGSQRELGFINELGPYCEEIVPVRHSALAGALNCLAAIPSRRPFQLAYFDSEEMRRAVAGVAVRKRFDLVYVHLIRMADYAKPLAGVRKVLAIEDPLSLHYEHAVRYRKGLTRVAYEIEGRRVQTYEHRISREYDACLVVSPRDKEVLEERGGFTHLALSPHGVDLDYFSPQYAASSGPPKLLFSGNMGYHPNVDAVLYFCEQILPNIWRAVPNARLTVVGTNPPAAVRRLAHDPRITITGYVNDIRPFFIGASAAVCPLRIGAGIQNKLLEALSMGIPVVATPLAAAGTAVEPETHVLLAKDAEAFAQQTVRLLADPHLGAVLSKSGRRLVEEWYDWKTNLKALEPIFFPSRAPTTVSP